jgi:hypothetical protein
MTRNSVVLSRRTAAAVLIFLAGMVYGFLAHRNHLPPYGTLLASHQWLNGEPADGENPAGAPPGLWRETPGGGTNGLSDAQRQAIDELSAVGYLGGTHEAPPGQGVVSHEPGLAYEGLNLYCSGHGPEAILMDMNGEVLHSWRLPYEAAFPEREDPGEFRSEFWRKVHVYPNGDLLANFEGLGLVKVDRNSNLLWSVHNAAHHDMDVAADGTIYVLTRIAHMVPEVHESEPILEDFITVLSPDGAEIRRHSILDAMMNSDFATLMQYSSGSGDIFHTNSLELLPSRGATTPPFVKEGHALVSLAFVHTVAVIDLEENKIVWALAGLTRDQHDPTLLENGNLLIFDNGTEGRGSRVLEVDPESQEIVWRYPSRANRNFFTPTCGASQRLPNGNTLITISELGRALEVTPDHRVVWEFHSQHRAGARQELVATLMDVRRLEADFFSGWRNGLPKTN